MQQTGYQPVTERIKIGRLQDRGVYDQEEINRILDQARICHVGFVLDNQPYVMPMAYGRRDNDLILHGSNRSRLMQKMAQGLDLCITVTLLDGLVLARSAFHHSMNYRSVVALGRAQSVTDPDEKARLLDVLVEHLAPGRSTDSRSANQQELKATLVVKFPLTEVSAKVRTGPPKDTKRDMSLDVWAGVVPIAEHCGAPIDAPDLDQNIQRPDYLQKYKY